MHLRRYITAGHIVMKILHCRTISIVKKSVFNCCICLGKNGPLEMKKWIHKPKQIFLKYYWPFQNRQNLMSNIYDISPDWVSDRSVPFNISTQPRSLDWTWKYSLDPLPRQNYTPRLLRKNSDYNDDVIIGINDARKASINVPLPVVMPKTKGYRLPSVTNPMGPCLTKLE